MTESSIVEKNFSRDPDYYHLHAATQLYVADKLAEIIAEHAIGSINSVLGIGCGTGFLTEKLFVQFPEAEVDFMSNTFHYRFSAYLRSPIALTLIRTAPEGR